MGYFSHKQALEGSLSLNIRGTFNFRQALVFTTVTSTTGAFSTVIANRAQLTQSIFEMIEFINFDRTSTIAV